MLVETVQSALRPPKVSKELTERQEGQPADRKELSWKTQCRLHGALPQRPNQVKHRSAQHVGGSRSRRPPRYVRAAREKQNA
jgi:hypothetical protein